MVITELAAVSVQMIRTGPVVLDGPSASSVVEALVGEGEDVMMVVTICALAADDEEEGLEDSESESRLAVGLEAEASAEVLGELLALPPP
jgi:hypothetical protein